MKANERQLVALMGLVERGVKGRVGFYLGRPVVLGKPEGDGWIWAYDPDEDKALRFWAEQIKTLPFGRRVQRPLGVRSVSDNPKDQT